MPLDTTSIPGIDDLDLSELDSLPLIAPRQRFIGSRGRPMDTLYINDATEIFLPITRRGSNVIDATVTFSVWTTEDDSGEVIGTPDQAMAWESELAKYTAIFPADEGALLEPFDVDEQGPYYWVHITANGITDRRVKCKAMYRGAK